MKADILAFHTKWWDIKKVSRLMKEVGFKKIKVKLINFNLRIDPKISISLIREWQKLEYSFTKRKEVLENIKLNYFLHSNKEQIEKYGLEFPTEYVLMGKK